MLKSKSSRSCMQLQRSDLFRMMRCISLFVVVYRIVICISPHLRAFLEVE